MDSELSCLWNAFQVFWGSDVESATLEVQDSLCTLQNTVQLFQLLQTSLWWLLWGWCSDYILKVTTICNVYRWGEVEGFVFPSRIVKCSCLMNPSKIVMEHETQPPFNPHPHLRGNVFFFLCQDGIILHQCSNLILIDALMKLNRLLNKIYSSLLIAVTLLFKVFSIAVCEQLLSFFS